MKKRRLHSTKLLAGSMLMMSIAALAPIQTVHAQNKVSTNNAEEAGIITGIVSDDKGEPLPGASVALKGSGAGTVTDMNGHYEIELPKGVSKGILVFSSVGFGTKEMAFDGFADQNVKMSAQAGDLNEVVVIGYGTAKKKDLTASIATVDSKDFNKGVFGTPDQMIQGKVPGLVITPSSGQPGVSGTIRIRGSASLTGNNDPLIVIDGVPVDNSTMGGAPSALSMINPNDIESFTVLKDAAATAIYGNRASNGVIIVTTKKGSSGDFHVNLSSTLSYLDRYNSVDVLTAGQAKHYITNNGTPEQIARIGTANTNWQNEIFHNTLATDNNLSFSGGVKNLPYRLSVGYQGQQGLLKTTDLKRTSVALNLNPSFFNNSLKVDVNIKGVETHNRFASTSVIGNALRMDPTQPVKDGSQFGGYFEYTQVDTAGNVTLNPNAPKNPVGELNSKNDISTVKRGLANIQLEYRLPFLKDLKAVVNTGVDLTKSNGSVTIDPNSAVAYTTGGSYKEYSEYRRNELFDAYLNYTKEIPDADSRFDITAGYGYQDYYHQLPGNQTMSITKPTDTISAANPFETQNTLVSFYGRFSYTYKGRYLFSSSIRRDGSSRFSPDNRWGTFGGASVAWRISQENFLKDTKISDLKLRAGIGSTGQQDLNTGDYPYLPVYKQSNSQTGYMFGNSPIVTYVPQPYDNNLKWESTTAYNVGLDYGFFNNRLTGSIDFYKKNTTNLLNDVLVPAGSNLSNHVVTNIGSMQNKGFEIALNAIPVSTHDFTWSFGVNLAYNHNKITKLTSAGADDQTTIPTGDISGGTGSKIQVIGVGDALNAFYVYQQVYGQNGQPLEGVYAMQQGNQLLYVYKSPTPNVTMGFNTQFIYKKWSLSMSGHASFGNYMYNNVKSANGFQKAILDPLNFNANASTDLLNTNFEFGQYFSDHYMENASFLRMDNIVLGYNFGKVGKSGLALQVSAIVQNAFVITNYSGLDPEIFSGIDNNVYPKPRIWSLALNVGF